MNEKKVDVNKALEILKNERQRRIATCRQEIQAVLNKHNCRLAAQVTFTDGRVRQEVIVLPLD